MLKKIAAAMTALFLLVTFIAIPQTALAVPAPKSIAITPPTTSVDIASTSALELYASVSPEDASQDVTWKSSNTTIASVSASGVVTFKKTGNVTITATARGTKVTARRTIAVTDSRIPKSVSLSARTMVLRVGATGNLSASVNPAGASQDIVWKTSNISVASVSPDGTITAKKAGSATITAQSARNAKIKTTARVTVQNLPAPRSIILDGNFSNQTTSLNLGEKLQLSAAPNPADTSPLFSWKTSSSARATVSASGLVTAKKSGAVTITVTSRQNAKIKATYKLLIVDPRSPSRIIPNVYTLTLNPGNSEPILTSVEPSTAVQTLKWTSSSTSVATVNAQGVIVAKKAGSATITARSTYNSSIAATIKVSVKKLPPPTSLAIGAPSDTIAVGSKHQLAALPSPAASDAQVAWKSSNTKRATVSSTGVVTGVAGGSATITATSKANSRVLATYVLTVTDPKMPTSMSLSDNGTITLDVKQTWRLNASAQPSTVAQSFTWSSSSAAIAKVDANGLVTGVKAGTVTITATHKTYNNVKASVQVKVVSRATPTKIAASIPSADGVQLRGESQLNIVTTPADASRAFTFASANTGIATVNERGVVYGVKAGTVNITITSKVKTTVKVTVPVTVYDPAVPSRVMLNQAAAMIGPDDTITLVASISPASAPQGVTWKSSNTGVATVSDTGVVRGVSMGNATITATSNTGNKTTTSTVTVLQTALTKTMPLITTDIGGISSNLAMIDAVRRSAINEVLRLQAQSDITAAESSERQAIVNRAFDMQAFPWMTAKIQEYYNPAYANKRYVPDIVYYGLPYIQHGANKVYTNRQYDKAKAVSNGYFVSSGQGYYLMNHDKRLNGTYIGNDCSSFVSMAQFGTNGGSKSYANTTGMYSATYYKTITDWGELRPGDLLVKSGNHVVLFLYFTDASKSQYIIIHQGGEYSTSHCMVNRNYDQANGYIARRQTTFK